jgi:hypothetical protein
MARGSRAYADASPLESAAAYREARERASALGDFRAEIEARFWGGCALHGAGRLRASLAEMAPGLQHPEASIGQGDIYRLATRYVRVLAELPVETARVERAVSEIEESLAAHGRPWRSRPRLALARLHISTGEWRRGLVLAREALELRKNDPYGCTLSSYYWVVVILAIWVGEEEEVREAMAAWERQDLPASQRAFHNWARSQLRRRRGDTVEALSFARRARIESLEGCDYPAHVSTTIELARALLSVGRLGEAREAVLDAQRWRGSEVGDHAFSARVLPGDWHLASARALFGLPALDADFGGLCDGEDPLAPDHTAAERALGRARLAYRRLLPRARALDRCTGTRLRAWQLDARLALCDRSHADGTAHVLRC